MSILHDEICCLSSVYFWLNPLSFLWKHAIPELRKFYEGCKSKTCKLGKSQKSGWLGIMYAFYAQELILFFHPGLEMSQSCVLKEAVVCKAVVREAGNCSDLDKALQEDDLVVTMHVCYLGNQILFYIMLDSSPTPSFSQAQINTKSLHWMYLAVEDNLFSFDSAWIVSLFRHGHSLSHKNNMQ